MLNFQSFLISTAHIVQSVSLCLMELMYFNLVNDKELAFSVLDGVLAFVSVKHGLLAGQ